MARRGDKLRTWEVKSVGAALISAVVEARRGQKRTGKRNPLRSVLRAEMAGEVWAF